VSETNARIMQNSLQINTREQEERDRRERRQGGGENESVGGNGNKAGTLVTRMLTSTSSRVQCEKMNVNIKVRRKNGSRCGGRGDYLVGTVGGWWSTVAGHNG